MSDQLPDGWRWVKLAEVCQINPRRPRNLAISPETDVTFVPMAAVSDQFAAITGAINRPYAEVSRGYTYMEDGDVIFAKITPCMQNGKHAIVRDTRTGFAFGSTEFHVLRPSDVLDARLLHSFLLRSEFLQEAERNFTGTAGQQRVPKEFMASVSFPLPPLDEQHRIVARLEEQLTTAERARSAALAQLAAIEAMPQALLRQIFPRSPAESLTLGWRWAKLGEVARYINGRAFKPSDWTTTGLPIVRIQNLTNPSAHYNRFQGYVEPKYLIDNDDLLVAWSASLGVHRWDGGPAILNQHIFKVDEDESLVTRAFLHYALKTVMSALKVQSHGATMQHVTKPRFEATQFPLPPIDEQRRIVRELDEQTAAIKRARAGAQAQIDAIEALPAAALRLAFTP